MKLGLKMIGDFRFFVSCIHKIVKTRCFLLDQTPFFLFDVLSVCVFFHEFHVFLPSAHRQTSKFSKISARPESPEKLRTNWSELSNQNTSQSSFPGKYSFYTLTRKKFFQAPCQSKTVFQKFLKSHKNRQKNPTKNLTTNQPKNQELPH